MRDLRTGESCGGFELRRLHAGEVPEPRATVLRAHVHTCAACAATWAELGDDTASLERALPFDDFSEGVRRRLPRARAEAPRELRSGRTRGLLLKVVPIAAAASLALVAGGRFLVRPDGTRSKGSAVELIVGGTGTTHAAVDGEQLGPGERVRIKVVPGQDERFGLAVSVDEAGQVSPLYDDAGQSLTLQPGQAQVLPDSLAFDGSGAERVYVLLSREPLRTSDVSRAASEELRRAGSVESMGNLPLTAEEQSTQLLRKP